MQDWKSSEPSSLGTRMRILNRLTQDVSDFYVMDHSQKTKDIIFHGVKLLHLLSANKNFLNETMLNQTFKIIKQI